MGLGERLACKIMTAVLRDQVLAFISTIALAHHPCQGIDAEYVSLENVVPDPQGLDGEDGYKTLDQAFYDNLASALRDRIEHCGSRVPVVTGVFYIHRI